MDSGVIDSSGGAERLTDLWEQVDSGVTELLANCAQREGHRAFERIERLRATLRVIQWIEREQAVLCKPQPARGQFIDSIEV